MVELVEDWRFCRRLIKRGESGEAREEARKVVVVTQSKNKG